jgi:hypothetical protein
MTFAESLRSRQVEYSSGGRCWWRSRSHFVGPHFLPFSRCRARANRGVWSDIACYRARQCGRALVLDRLHLASRVTIDNHDRLSTLAEHLDISGMPRAPSCWQRAPEQLQPSRRGDGMDPADSDDGPAGTTRSAPSDASTLPQRHFLACLERDAAAAHQLPGSAARAGAGAESGGPSTLTVEGLAVTRQASRRRLRPPAFSRSQVHEAVRRQWHMARRRWRVAAAAAHAAPRARHRRARWRRFGLDVVAATRCTPLVAGGGGGGNRRGSGDCLPLCLIRTYEQLQGTQLVLELQWWRRRRGMSVATAWIMAARHRATAMALTTRGGARAPARTHAPRMLLAHAARRTRRARHPTRPLRCTRGRRGARRGSLRRRRRVVTDCRNVSEPSLWVV